MGLYLYTFFTSLFDIKMYTSTARFTVLVGEKILQLVKTITFHRNLK